MTGEVRWFAGIDWAAERHQLCLLSAAGGEPVGEHSVLHGGGQRASLGFSAQRFRHDRFNV